MIRYFIVKFKKCINRERLKISEMNTDLMIRYKNYLIHDAGLISETPYNYFTRFKRF
jgi:hypothetical protein